MKTTLEIPDALFRKAKATAAHEGRTMKQFVTEALAEKLAGKGRQQGWRAVLGKLSPDGKKAAREAAAAVQAADFNKVDPEVWR